MREGKQQGAGAEPRGPAPSLELSPLSWVKDDPHNMTLTTGQSFAIIPTLPVVSLGGGTQVGDEGNAEGDKTW